MKRAACGSLRIVWAVLVFVALISAGCGSDNDSSPSSNSADAIISNDDTTDDDTSDDDTTGDDSILIFSDFQAASVVIGQADFTSRVYSGTAAADNFNEIYGNPVVYNDILYLTDYGYARVLGFNTIPTTNGASADFVLGQPDFTTAVCACDEDSMAGPQGLSVYDGKLFLTDFSNNRVTIYNTVPTSGPGSADVVVGQTDFVHYDIGDGAAELYGPETSIAVDGKLIVTDTDNNRVMIWNSIPTTNGAAADIVLGQSDFGYDTANDDDQDGSEDSQPSARTMYNPSGVWSDGTRLVVLDHENNRVLIWNTFPTASFTAADVVLGQADFTHNAPNDDDQDGSEDSAPTARTLKKPYDGVYCKNGQLFVCDSYNNRVLIWDTFPTQNFTPADSVLGQGDFAHNEYNDADQNGTEDGQPAASTLNFPDGIYVDGDKLIVADKGNYRYLVYEAF